MRSELETYHLIQRYLSGELSGNELTEFETLLNTDALLYEEVEYQKVVNEVVIGAQYHNLRTQISSDLKTKNTQSVRLKWIGGFLAVLITGLGTWLMMDTDSPAKLPHTAKAENQKSPGTTSISMEDEKTFPSATTHSTAVQVNTDPEHPLPEYSTETPIAIPPMLQVEEIPTNKLRPEPETKRQVEEKTTDKPCATVNIEVPVTVLSSCDHDATGSIQVHMEKISGGTPPYQLQFNERDTRSSHFYKLSGGTYQVTVLDQEGCSKTLNMEVEETTCRILNATFSPSIGEVWTVPAKTNLGFKVSVRSRGGQLLYQALYESGTVAEWNGVSNGGAEVEAGLYIYLIEYSNGERETGQLTLIR